MKITNRNTTKRKNITFIKRESNLFNAIREKKLQFRAKIGLGSAQLHWQALACTFTDSAVTFFVQMVPDFLNFSLNLDFEDSEKETPNKRI